MVQFTKPLYLLLLVPLGYYSWRLARQSLADISPFRARLALGLRLALITALVFALAGARMVRNASQESVIFVLDVSDSIPKAKQEAELRYLNTALKHRRSEQKVGVVVFGGDASVELTPCNARKLDKVYSVPNTSNTDISQALGLALASFPEQSAKKIVLLSDGNETIGKAVEQAALAGANGVSIDVVPVTNDLPREALLDKMIAPSSAKVGEPFDLKVIAVSKRPTLAQVRLLRNGAPAGVKAVELTGGKSVLTFRQSIPKPGNYEFRAILECPQDTIPENNAALAYTVVHGKPRVLYIEGQNGQEKHLAGALDSSDINVETRNLSGVPSSMAQLQGYDMVVFSDVPAWSLAPEQMQMIKSGVRDLGIGFTMIGGENSFGSGGYYDTPIEQALPVDMSVRKTKVLPSLSVVIVMDKSGSMSAIEGGREKIQLANDAAAAVVKMLQPIDKVGVIVCHSWPVAVVRLTSANNKSPIYREISTIRADGGGIAVFPSMKMANGMISGSGTRQKHVILLADGSDCDEQDGVLPLVKDMAARKITVTTVAIGDGEHVPFLKGVAYYGKGGFYLARRAADLKAIFTKDVMTVSKSLIIEEPFVPRVDTSSPELSGIDMDSVPPLLGYVATGPKPAARVSIASHKNDPILATWQYGLGRSAAFTSDCKARWSARWLGWPGYSTFWAQVLRSTMRRSASRDFQTSVDVSAGVGHVTIDAVDSKGSFINMLKLAGSVVGPDMRAHPLVIEQTGPGRYEASFDAREVGTYLVNAVRKDKSRSAPEVTVVSIPYPPEYKEITSNTGLLKRLAEETSGRFNPRVGDVFTSHFRTYKTYTDLWPILALLAAVLLPVDIAVRRVALSGELVHEVFARVTEKLAHRHHVKTREPQRVETVGTLLKSKKERVVEDEPVEVIAAPKVSATPTPAAPHQGNNSGGEDTTSRLLAAKRRAKEKNDNGID